MMSSGQVIQVSLKNLGLHRLQQAFGLYFRKELIHSPLGLESFGFVPIHKLGPLIVATDDDF